MAEVGGGVRSRGGAVRILPVATREFVARWRKKVRVTPPLELF